MNPVFHARAAALLFLLLVFGVCGCCTPSPRQATAAAPTPEPGRVRPPAPALLPVAATTTASAAPPLVRVEPPRDEAAPAGPAALSDLPPAVSRAAVAPQSANTGGGAGILVCAPVAKNADDDTARFGAACALWTYLQVGGQGELGQTPLLSSLVRAGRELKKPDLRLSGAAEAYPVARMTGATHVVTGEVSGSASGEGTLRFTLWDARKHKAVGTPLVLSGTRAQVVAGLPQLCRELARRVGVKTPRVPDRVELTPADLAFLGGRAWPGSIPRWINGDDANEARMESFARTSPLAALLFLESRTAVHDGVRRGAVVRALLAPPSPAAANPLVWAMIAYRDASELVPYVAAFRVLQKRFPNSYALAHTDVWLERVLSRPKAERVAAETAVRDAPANPDAWLSLGYTLSSAADRVRAGKVVSRITPDEMAYLEKVYPLWLVCVRRATQIDDRHEIAWLRVATAATFTGDRATADAAFWKALDRHPNKAEVYGWGLQMFQPKWGGDPADLAKVARLAAAERYDDMGTLLGIVRNLKDAGFAAEAAALTGGRKASADAALAKNPNDAQALYDLGWIAQQEERWTDALRAFEVIGRLRPADAEAQYELGLVYNRMERWQDAIQAYRETLRLDPRHARVRYDLGYSLKHENQIPEAEQQLKIAVRERPNYAEAHFGLADVYARQQKWKAAVPEYQTTLRLAPYFIEARTHLSQAFAESGRGAEAIQTAREAVRQRDNSVEARLALAYAYARANRIADCIAASRNVLVLDPQNGTAHEYLGESLLKTGHADEGRAYLEKCQTLGDPAAAAEARRVLAHFAGK